MSLAAITPDAPLVLVGAGRMGSALATGWLEAGLDPAALLVIDPSPPDEVAAAFAAKSVSVVAAPPSDRQAGLLVLAVKPQIIGEVMPGLKPLVGSGTVSLSIAAGITLATLEAGLGGAVVRAMPNTPAQIGRGITAAVANRAVTADGKTLAGELLAAVGEVVWVDDEALMDPVTAVSGSGPAYVFLLAESLAAAGEKAGLPADVAARLAAATVSGAGELLARSDLDAATLRQNVTSPGGTTEAALKVLMTGDALTRLMTVAVAAATRRSRELAG